ncbi:MAG: phosphatidylglycerophosphatase A [Alphaproteobacteria bacterium]|nr:phosphatidylglycerophosphatase A [Alphaproteobacteria bacterium]
MGGQARAARLIATGFGIGKLPWAPGTWGSLAALPLAWAIAGSLGPGTLLLAALALSALGIWAVGRHALELDQQDPGCIVVDEVAGQWLALAFVPPDLWLYCLGFLLFRLADIVKPWPASWIDRQMTGGAGIMADDLVAGLYAAAALAMIGEWLL